MANCASCLLAQPEGAGYELVFGDEFDSDQLDESAWWPTGGDACATHGEGDCEEEMWYRPDNVELLDGRLVITAKEETLECGGREKEYTSGWVQSAGNFRYGYYEIRAKVPAGNGFWPAFWFWASSNDTAYEEIDVLEFCGCECNEYQAGIWYEEDHDGIGNNQVIHQSSYMKLDQNACESFQTYGLEWTPEVIRFFLNDSLVATQSNINNHNPMAIILNLAIGGCYGGCNWTYCGGLNLDTNNGCHVSCTTTFPQTFEIDWVRAWQKKESATYIKGHDEVYIGQRDSLKTPHYPHATYTWSATPELTIIPSDYLNFNQGIWRTVDIIARTPGPHTLTLTVTFPSGYRETQAHLITGVEGLEIPIETIRDQLIRAMEINEGLTKWKKP